MNKRIEGIAGGYFPVYWELFDDYKLNYDDVFFFHYLAAVFPILRQQEIIDGKVYKWLGDDFIKAKFQDKLKGPRYYTILLDIDEAVNSGYYGINNPIKDDINDRIKDRLKNFETNNNKREIEEESYPETISPKEEKYPKGNLPY